MFSVCLVYLLFGVLKFYMIMYIGLHYMDRKLYFRENVCFKLMDLEQARFYLFFLDFRLFLLIIPKCEQLKKIQRKKDIEILLKNKENNNKKIKKPRNKIKCIPTLNLK